MTTWNPGEISEFYLRGNSRELALKGVGSPGEASTSSTPFSA
jgi:hypothetical protein